MTDEEKRQLVDAVLTELHKNNKDISTATIIDASTLGSVRYVFDSDGLSFFIALVYFNITQLHKTHPFQCQVSPIPSSMLKKSR